MTQTRSTFITPTTGTAQGILPAATGLVRLPKGADSSLFGGWGVRI